MRGDKYKTHQLGRTNFTISNPATMANLSGKYRGLQQKVKNKLTFEHATWGGD
jgi:hypothetical protein